MRDISHNDRKVSCHCLGSPRHYFSVVSLLTPHIYVYIPYLPAVDISTRAHHRYLDICVVILRCVFSLRCVRVVRTTAWLSYVHHGSRMVRSLTSWRNVDVGLRALAPRHLFSAPVSGIISDPMIMGKNDDDVLYTRPTGVHGCTTIVVIFAYIS